MMFLAATRYPSSSTTVSTTDFGKPLITTTFPYGLTATGTTDAFFTSELDLEAPLLLKSSSAFMTAARLDARARLGLHAATELTPKEAALVEEEVREHLSDASAMRHKFMCSSVVHDREEIKAALRDHFSETGQFALFLGGKNLGKSLHYFC